MAISPSSHQRDRWRNSPSQPSPRDHRERSPLADSGAGRERRTGGRDVSGGVRMQQRNVLVHVLSGAIEQSAGARPCQRRSRANLAQHRHPASAASATVFACTPPGLYIGVSLAVSRTQGSSLHRRTSDAVARAVGGADVDDGGGEYGDTAAATAEAPRRATVPTAAPREHGASIRLRPGALLVHVRPCSDALSLHALRATLMVQYSVLCAWRCAGVSSAGHLMVSCTFSSTYRL